MCFNFKLVSILYVAKKVCPIVNSREILYVYAAGIFRVFVKIYLGQWSTGKTSSGTYDHQMW